jgi:hypothetical protein
MATPTATAAAQGLGPASLTTKMPTTVAKRWPPIKERGWAGPDCGMPITNTIEVANGMAINGYPVFADANSMNAIAIAPPTAPSTIPSW